MKGIGKSGFTLLQAVIFISVIGFLGLIAAHLFTTGTAMNTDHVFSLRALYIAEGGLEFVGRYLKNHLENTGDANWGVQNQLPYSPAPQGHPISLGSGGFEVNFAPLSYNTLKATIEATIRNPTPLASRKIIAQVHKEVPGDGNPVTLTISNWREGP